MHLSCQKCSFCHENRIMKMWTVFVAFQYTTKNFQEITNSSTNFSHLSSFFPTINIHCSHQSVFSQLYGFNLDHDEHTLVHVRLISIRTEIYSFRSVIQSTSHDKRMYYYIATWHYSKRLHADYWFVHKQIMVSTRKYIMPRRKTTHKAYLEFITNKYE